MDLPSLPADPYEGYAPPAPGMVLTRMPPDPKHFQDPEWYDTLGGDRLQQDGVFKADKTAQEQIELVKGILRDTPTDLDGVDRGYEILFQASVYGSLAVTRWLLKDREPELGGPIDLSKGPPSSDPLILPLHVAAVFGHLDVVKCLIEEGKLPIDWKSAARETALMRAAMMGWIDVVRYLFEKGANPAATNGDEDESDHKGEHDGEDDGADDQGGEQGGDGDEGDWEDEDDNEMEGGDEDEDDRQQVRSSLVDYVARSGNLELLTAILEALASQSHRPMTPANIRAQLEERVQSFTIVVAAQSGSEEMVRYVLEESGKVANLGTSQDDPWRRGIIAALPSAPKTKTGSPLVVKRLLSYVLPLDSEGSYVRSDDNYLGEKLADGVVNAASRGYPDMLRLFTRTLRESCASTEAGSPEAFSKLLHEEALARCHQPRSLECASVLIEELGVDVNAMDPGNAHVTVLDSTVRFGSDESVKYLLSRGADLHLGRGNVANGATPLWLAVRGNMQSIIRLLLEHGGPVESKDDDLIGAKRVRLVAKLAYRCPVRMMVQTKPVEVAGKGWCVLDFPDGVTKEWLDRIQLRRPDAQLAQDGSQRPLLGPQESLTRADISYFDDQE